MKSWTTVRVFSSPLSLYRCAAPCLRQGAIKARSFANELVACPEIDWISITDNAGGNPQMAPLALGRPILYAGKEVVIHLTCKDQNRNGLESEAWMLNSEGFRNILAMTGDYPVSGTDGLAKPVFDIDSVGLISLLNKMNQGLRQGVANDGQRLDKTQFCIGAVTTNFKLREGEVVPQYLKLKKKIECGAQFIISQIGFDARKTSELRGYMDTHGAKDTPLIGNVYLLSSRVAQIFHEGRIPGVVVSDAAFRAVHGFTASRPIAARLSSSSLRQNRLPSAVVWATAARTWVEYTISNRSRESSLWNGRLALMTGSSLRAKSSSPGRANSFITRRIPRPVSPTPSARRRGPRHPAGK